MNSNQHEQLIRQQLEEHLSKIEPKQPSDKADKAILTMLQQQSRAEVESHKSWFWPSVAALIMVSFAVTLQFSKEPPLDPLKQVVMQSQQLELEIAQVEQQVENPLVWVEAKKIKSQIIDLDQELFVNYQSNGSQDKRLNLWLLRVKKLALLKTIYLNDNQLYRI
ncbi:hypothetical protein [Kangiella sp. TOML190]|uniref:hypothetical protein n=1 Tax=Kangiella sp. TOML190 TaxID=2931351 RepID=UPI0020402249|nr:hypothetical protein [Kangiella sp. TOML190]